MNLSRKLIVAALMLAMLAGNVPSGAQAAPNATITVQSAADDGTANAANCPGVTCRLRDAIAYASAGDTINFAGDYMIMIRTGTLTINKNLTIDGVGHTIILSGNHAVRVFSVNSGYIFNLQNITVKWGYSTSGFGGGGLYMSDASTVNVTNCTFSINSAPSGTGGGIYNTSGRLNVTNSTFANNSTLGGGGIYNSTGTVTVMNSTFANNSATYGGGSGIHNNSGTVMVMNSTFISNSVTHHNGGGLYNNFGAITVTNGTFSRNSATTGGGGLVNYSSGLFVVRNSIIAAQTAGADCLGVITSQGYNIESGINCGFTNGVNGDNQLLISGDSLNLQPLANNGVLPHPFTHALGAGSVAIDKIPNGIGCVAGISTDERGAVRAGGGTHGGALCDIGAYEVSDQGPNAVTLRDLTATTNALPGVIGAMGAALAALGALLIGRRVKAKARP